MPWDIILALVACVVAYIFLNYTKIGTYTYAIGSDEFVAKNMGINVNKYKVLAFILSGAFLGNSDNQLWFFNGSGYRYGIYEPKLRTDNGMLLRSGI